MKLYEHVLGLGGYLGNIFLLVASLKLQDVDLLLAITLKIFTIISTSCVTVYYFYKMKSDIKKNKDENIK